MQSLSGLPITFIPQDSFLPVATKPEDQEKIETADIQETEAVQSSNTEEKPEQPIQNAMTQTDKCKAVFESVEKTILNPSVSIEGDGEASKPEAVEPNDNSEAKIDAPEAQTEEPEESSTTKEEIELAIPNEPTTKEIVNDPKKLIDKLFPKPIITIVNMGCENAYLKAIKSNENSQSDDDSSEDTDHLRLDRDRIITVHVEESAKEECSSCASVEKSNSDLD